MNSISSLGMGLVGLGRVLLEFSRRLLEDSRNLLDCNGLLNFNGILVDY